MNHFKIKNILWAISFVLYAFAGNYARVPMLDWAEAPKGYWYNLLGFSPLILMGLYNARYISEKPLKKYVGKAFYLSLISFIYFMLIVMVVALRGAFLIPVFVAPLGFFLANVIKHIRGFMPK